VKTVDLRAVQIANGADELLGEVSASKIAGEEERYSHIDLVDFEGQRRRVRRRSSAIVLGGARFRF